VLTLALGIGATTAIFSVVYGVLIKPLPYPDADELVSLRHAAPGLMRTIGFPADTLPGMSESMYVTYREENRAFEHVGLYTSYEHTLTGLGETEQIRALAVTDGTLQALGVQPVLGRWFFEAEHTLGGEGPLPVILSHAFWQQRFGGDESALGRPLSLDYLQFQVVGVMPADFRFLDMSPQPGIITPVRTDGVQIAVSSTQRSPWLLTLSPMNYEGLARLSDGVTLEAANADVGRMLSIWLDAWPTGGRSREAIADWQVAPALRPLKDDVVGGIAGMLWLLMGTVGAVLLIACANIANLVLTRADARRQELAIRAALGAGRRRIAGELLRESFVLGAIGGVVGLALAYAGLELIAAIAPPNLPRAGDITVGAPVLAFAVVAALASSLLFGVVPALKHAFGTHAVLGTGPPGVSASPETNGARTMLIVVQVALALVLLVGAGLMIRTFEALTDVDPGFSDPENVQVADIFVAPLVIPDHERATRMKREILDRIAALPGVSAAGFGPVALGRGLPRRAIAVEDGREDADEPPPTRASTEIWPGYFEAFGTRLVAGRDLTWADIDEARNVALVSENLARELWGEPQAAIGKRVRGSWDDPESWREIIGVTQDVREELYERPPATVYLPSPMEGNDYRGGTFAIRSERAGTESLFNEVRQAVWASHPDLVLRNERTMQDIYSDSLARTSFVLVLFAIAGAMALTLSVIGIYGVISYIVSQRSREIGIRLALGAQAPAVKRMFIRYGLAVATIGMTGGAISAAALGRFLDSLIFSVEPLDPATYLAVFVLLLAAVLIAAYVPARRASSIAPFEALRHE
jgi:predicted permease